MFEEVLCWHLWVSIGGDKGGKSASFSVKANSAAILWINHSKTGTQFFLQFSVSFICLEAYTKNPPLFDLQKLFFWTTCKVYVIWVIWGSIFYLEEESEKCPACNFCAICRMERNLGCFEINLCWEYTNNSFKNDGSILLMSAKITCAVKMPWFFM